MREEVKIAAETDPSPQDVESVSHGLLQFNEEHLGPARETKVVVFARDATGRIVGGLLGHHRWTWLYVHRVWVERSCRGHGIGRRLLEHAEELAAAAGCRHAALETFSFQAPSFYERQGHVVYATLDDFPPGHRQLFMRKALATSADAAAAQQALQRTGRCPDAERHIVGRTNVLRCPRAIMLHANGRRLVA